MPVLPVPRPYGTYPRSVLSVFRRFHDLTGEWPWQLVEYFEPHYWSYKLAFGFYSLLKNELPRTGGVTLDGLVRYLFEKSVQHPISKYRCVLSNKVIDQAAEWMAEKRQDSIRGLRSDSRRRSATCGRDHSRGPELVQSQACSSRKRSAEGDVSNEEARVPAAFAKKRLMVTFNFQPKPVGDSIVVEGDESDQPAGANPLQANGGRSNVQTGLITPVGESGYAEESPFLDVTFKTLEEAQQAYCAYLKGEITTSGNVIRRSEDEIEATRRRHSHLIQKLLQDDAAKDNAASEVAEAQQSLHHAQILHATDTEALREAHRRASDPSTAVSAQEIADLTRRKRESGEREKAELAAVEAKQKLLDEISTRLKLTEDDAAVLTNRLIELGDAKEKEEKTQLDLIILRRLNRLGPKLIDLLRELLGDEDIDEWTKEKLREIRHNED